MLKQPNCPFAQFVGTWKLVKRREFEEFIRHEIIIWFPRPLITEDLSVMMIYRLWLKKWSLCAILYSCVGLFFWVKKGVRTMGKNLKGKECGKGICQRKDGLYFARFYSKDGRRQGRYFETLPEAKNWLADAWYEERHSIIVTAPDMTVDKWFDYWIENIVCDLAPNTKWYCQD